MVSSMWDSQLNFLSLHRESLEAPDVNFTFTFQKGAKRYMPVQLLTHSFSLLLFLEQLPTHSAY